MDPTPEDREEELPEYLPMDAQQQHDEELLATDLDSLTFDKEAAARILARNRSRQAAARAQTPTDSSTGDLLLDDVLRTYPGLSREQAEEMLEAFVG